MVFPHISMDMIPENELVGQYADEGMQKLLLAHHDLVDAGMEEALSPKFSDWAERTRRSLEEVFPHREEQRSYENALHDYSSGRAVRETLISDIANCKGLERYQKETWLAEIPAATPERLREIQEEFLSAWGEILDRKSADWYLSALMRRRNEFLLTMEAWLRFVEAARKASSAMSAGNGIFWDLSESDFTDNDTSELLSWAEEFKRDTNLRNLCAILGRAVCSARSQREVQVSSVSVEKVVDRSLEEELAGVETGDRIEDLLASEKGLLIDPELEILFDIKYAEKRLMCFDKQGYSEVLHDDEKHTVSSDEEAMGPIILCIDTSGSMQGSPEHIAKAVALYIGFAASEQNRRCYLINFSKDIRTCDLAPPGGTRTLLDFIRYSFHGGTDIVPALREAVWRITDSEYSKADVLLVSDFVMPPDALNPVRSDMESARKRGCRFHSLTIGSFPFGPELKKEFDRCWTYNPAVGKVVSD